MCRSKSSVKMIVFIFRRGFGTGVFLKLSVDLGETLGWGIELKGMYKRSQKLFELQRKI